MKRIFLHLILILWIGLICSVSSFSNEDIEKINKQLDSVENLFETGVIDEETYNNSKKKIT